MYCVCDTDMPADVDFRLRVLQLFQRFEDTATAQAEVCDRYY